MKGAANKGRDISVRKSKAWMEENQFPAGSGDQTWGSFFGVTKAGKRR
jgi:hypothetical protein